MWPLAVGRGFPTRGTSPILKPSIGGSAELIGSPSGRPSATRSSKRREVSLEDRVGVCSSEASPRVATDVQWAPQVIHLCPKLHRPNRLRCRDMAPREGRQKTHCGTRLSPKRGQADTQWVTRPLVDRPTPKSRRLSLPSQRQHSRYKKTHRWRDWSDWLWSTRCRKTASAPEAANPATRSASQDALVKGRKKGQKRQEKTKCVGLTRERV